MLEEGGGKVVHVTGKEWRERQRSMIYSQNHHETAEEGSRALDAQRNTKMRAMYGRQTCVFGVGILGESRAQLY